MQKELCLESYKDSGLELFNLSYMWAAHVTQLR